MWFEVLSDRHQPFFWRVEAIDDESDGKCYLAVFSGPAAEQRAREYAAWKNGKSGGKGIPVLATCR